MPRTGGVFSLLSGSKGSPNTTIQSASYNAQLDDLALDANTPRPVTAGGTGMTNLTDFKNSLGLAAVASSGSASDLTTGTLHKDRMASLLNATAFSEYITARTGAAGVNGYARLNSGLTDKSGFVDFFQKNDTRAAYIGFADATAKLVNMFAEPGYRFSFTGNLAPLINGYTIWTAENDGAGSTLDADLLDGQQGGFYQNASNLNSGTVADARLPSTQSGKVFNSDVTMFSNVFACTTGGVLEVGAQNGSALPAVIDLHTSATPVDYNARIIANGGTTTGSASLSFVCGPLYHNNAVIWDESILGYLGGGEAEAGTSETKRVWSAADVKRAIAALAPVSPPGLGVGQTWQNVKPDRFPGVVYQNTSGKPISAYISMYEANQINRWLQVSSNGSNWVQVAGVVGGGGYYTIIVPNNHYYQVTGGVSNLWFELR